MLNIDTILGFIAVITLSACIIHLFHRNRDVLYTASLLIFQCAWIAGSVAYIESEENLLLVSTWMTSQSVGAIWALLVLYAAFYLGFLIPNFNSVRGGKNNAPQNGLTTQALDSRWLLVAIQTPTIYHLLNSLVSPNILSDASISRANFFQTSILPLAASINIAIPSFLALAGVVAAHKSAKYSPSTLIHFMPLMAVLCASFLNGTQFSGYVVALYSFVVPYLIRRKISKRLFSRTRTLTTLGAGVTLAAAVKLISFNNSTDYANVTDSGLGRFLYRAFGLQGEVFWATFLRFSESPNTSQMRTEALVMLHTKSAEVSGIYALMTELVPNYTGSSDYTLNAGFPAIVVYSIGYNFTAVVTCTLSGIFYGVVCRQLVLAIQEGDLLRVFGAFGMTYSSYLAFTMGGMFYFASWAFVLSSTVFTIGLICSKNSYQHSNYEKS